MIGFIPIFGIVSVVILIFALIFDLKIESYNDSLLAYTILGLIIAWLIVGFGYWTVLIRC